MWKGLLKPRVVVERGACLAISNRHDVNIWTCPWIPTLPLFKATANPNLADLPVFQVADLIDPFNRTWNCALLEDLFDMDSVIRFLKYTFHSEWHLIDGLGYQLLLVSFRLGLLMRLSPLIHTADPLFSPEIWSCLWGFKLQHRLKHLLLKIAWDILHVRANTGRFITSEEQYDWMCPCCKGTQEVPYAKS